MLHIECEFLRRLFPTPTLSTVDCRLCIQIQIQKTNTKRYCTLYVLQSQNTTPALAVASQTTQYDATSSKYSYQNCESRSSRAVQAHTHACQGPLCSTTAIFFLLSTETPSLKPLSYNNLLLHQATRPPENTSSTLVRARRRPRRRRHIPIHNRITTTTPRRRHPPTNPEQGLRSNPL